MGGRILANTVGLHPVSPAGTLMSMFVKGRRR
jgi:hypothetical protein